MSTRTELESEMTLLAEKLARLQQKLDQLNELPEEPEADPAVVFFEKHFGKKQKYTYVAVRVADGLWSITGNAPGRNPNPKTWQELIVFACQAEKSPVELWYATELQKIEVQK